MNETMNEKPIDSATSLGLREGIPKLIPIHRLTPKIGRNAKCPCGSGKKYKKCCLFTKKG